MGGGTTPTTAGSEPLWPLSEATTAKDLKSMCVERGLVAGKKEECIYTLRRWRIINEESAALVGKLKEEGFVPPTEEPQNALMMIADAAGAAGGPGEDGDDDDDENS